MKRIFKKSISTKKIVFKAKIELNSEYREQLNSNSNHYYNSNRLKPDNIYWFNKKERKVSYEELQYELAEIIEIELLPEVNKLLKDNIILDVQVIDTDEGSIEIIFEVLLFAGTAILSGIIYDLIKYGVKKVLTRRLINNYGDFFNIGVTVISPSIIGNPYELKGTFKEKSAFFYYLLFSNFFLMGIIFGIVLAVIFYLIK